jgi:hypothetical protein
LKAVEMVNLAVVMANVMVMKLQSLVRKIVAIQNHIVVMANVMVMKLQSLVRKIVAVVMTVKKPGMEMPAAWIIIVYM